MSRFAVLPAMLVLAGCSQSQPPPPPMEVSVVEVTDAPNPLRLSYTARTRGVREVEVRARVSGILLRRFYTEGATVRAGDRLFQIDPQQFLAEVRSAQGRLGVEEARLNAADRQWQRVRPLAERGFLSRQRSDAAEADYIAGKAAVAAARADLARARLDLGYTDVRAPISGVTGDEAHSEGSLVEAGDDSALLTTISQAEQLYVDFSLPEDEARLLRDAVTQRPNSVQVRLTPASGSGPAKTAVIDFINSRVTPETGTVEVRALLAQGRDGLLSSGQFVRADILGLTTTRGIYAPMRAVLNGAMGPLLWVVKRDNTVEMRTVKTGPSNGDLIRIETGIRPHERIVVDGILKLQPGMPVKPVRPAK